MIFIYLFIKQVYNITKHLDVSNVFHATKYIEKNSKNIQHITSTNRIRVRKGNQYWCKLPFLKLKRNFKMDNIKIKLPFLKLKRNLKMDNIKIGINQKLSSIALAIRIKSRRPHQQTLSTFNSLIHKFTKK